MNDVLVICTDSKAKQLITHKLGRDADVRYLDALPKSTDINQQLDLVFIDEVLIPANAEDAFQQTIKHWRRHNPRVQFVALAPQGLIRRAIAAVRQWASDFLTYPIDDAEINTVIQALASERAKYYELEYLRDRFWKADWLDAVCTSNPAMKQIYKKIGSVASTIATVLLLGQTGTGKGWMARLIHRHSHRSEDAFVAVHCGAIPDTLIESELFGHEKGAFTGAQKRKIGKFELAQNGTIFLDEIGTISPEAQIKLLQVLQDGTFSRLGGEETLKTNARIIAATNADLEQMAAEGTFRKDLFYRLNIFPIQLPPLSQRQEDIANLVAYFLDRLNKKYGKNIAGLQPGVVDALKAYEWPGNLRELENVLERAYILETGDLLQPENFPETLIINSKIVEAMDEDRSMPIAQARQIAIDEFERTYLERLLRKHKGRVGMSAKEAQITSRQLTRLVTKHGLDKKNFKR